MKYPYKHSSPELNAFHAASLALIVDRLAWLNSDEASHREQLIGVRSFGIENRSLTLSGRRACGHTSLYSFVPGEKLYLTTDSISALKQAVKLRGEITDRNDGDILFVDRAHRLNAHDRDFILDLPGYKLVLFVG